MFLARFPSYFDPCTKQVNKLWHKVLKDSSQIKCTRMLSDSDQSFKEEH